MGPLLLRPALVITATVSDRPDEGHNRRRNISHDKCCNNRLIVDQRCATPQTTVHHHHC